MTTRRTRIVCISDTHGQTPKLPKADILVHAGDLTNQGSFSELEKQVRWLKAADCKMKLVVCGNHDITCDRAFYQEYGGYFHSKKMEDSDECIALFQSDPSLIFLNHESKVVEFKHDDGVTVALKVFGSPYSPALRLWAFGYAPEDAFHLWDQIPLDSDIVITHTPPKFHCDESKASGSVGCEKLREAMWRVRPKLHVCGHIHEGYGIETVKWDLACPNVKFKEQSVRRWKDPLPESRKQFHVDLSSRSRDIPLHNDGSITDLAALVSIRLEQQDQKDHVSDKISGDLSLPEQQMVLPAARGTPRSLFPDSAKANRPINPKKRSDNNSEEPATRGQGGSATSPRSDQEALIGREGRVETCIINAAFMASNWPHKGGKKFQKPILVDLDLPVVNQQAFHAVNAEY